MMKKLEYCEKAICRKIGNMFELAEKKGYYPLSFTEKWCQSTIAKEMYELVAEKIAQSPLYVLDDVINEYPNMDNGRKCNKDGFMYWLGYIITYASYALEESPEDLYKKYDIPTYMASYDVLHTLSSTRMVEEMANEYDKVKNIKTNMLGTI